MNKIPLHELDELHASHDLKKKTLQQVMNRKTKHVAKGFSFGIVITACVCLFMFLYQGNPFLPLPYETKPPGEQNKIAYSYVSIDINPSMELTLDKNNEVIGIKTFNNDAQVLLNDYHYENKDAQTVLKEIVSLPAFQPYLEQGFLQVSVYSDDQSTSSTIEKILDTTLSQVLEQEQYGCSCASRQEKEIADTHHMSFGKYQIIDEIINKNTTYKISDLQDASMRELKDIYEESFQKPFVGNSHNGNEGCNGNTNNGHHGQKHKKAKAE